MSTVLPLQNFFSLIILTFLILSAGCSANLSNSQAVDKDVLSGTYVDNHGCIATAGYNWSQLRKECIRLWESGTALTNVRDTGASTVAYLITTNDSTSIELFLPELNASVLLDKKDGNWVDSKNRYSLTKNGDSSYQLNNTKGILLYQSSN